MPTLTEHLIFLTDHRDRDHLELTLCKAVVDLLPIERVVVSRVLSEDGSRRWLEVASLDVRGGGKVVDPLRVDFEQLPLLEEHGDRLRALETNAEHTVAWAGEDGPRITYMPLFAPNPDEELGVLELHTDALVPADELHLVHQLRHVFRSMYQLLAYSDRDGLTGLLNRQALDDTFYKAVLDELGVKPTGLAQLQSTLEPQQERRHRVPPNYWLGTLRVDGFSKVSEQHGHLLAEEVLLLIARILGNTFRAYDRLYRLGGDQFAVLMHCPQDALVHAAFERLRANVEKFTFPQVENITISAGYTRVTPDDSPAAALERTEDAMEYGRQHGGNQIHHHAELVSRGIKPGQPRRGGVDLF
ncbi:GGDEF domain-containing protein [Curvibacter sp. CHRR-16]|uniref:GGDEF domain-containing protein n=1 Tax=Curvibacter sp. CHRR-16 TaxID=2835872 RepID=UPI001BDA43EB|nr:GGDEF domain-containing protein [Curvibacter sp. CHRR-16]MBT0571382.1 GGDEF domain-containing protein [Curvibacter sp. CHRR-16]